jgi:hypothetical protein
MHQEKANNSNQGYKEFVYESAHNFQEAEAENIRCLHEFLNQPPALPYMEEASKVPERIYKHSRLDKETGEVELPTVRLDTDPFLVAFDDEGDTSKETDLALDNMDQDHAYPYLLTRDKIVCGGASISSPTAPQKSVMLRKPIPKSCTDPVKRHNICYPSHKTKIESHHQCMTRRVCHPWQKFLSLQKDQDLI